MVVFEKSVLEKCCDILEDGKVLNKKEFNVDEEKLLRGYQFLTFKPLLIVINISEKDLASNSVNEYDFTATLFDLGGTTKNINVNFGADLRWGGATDVRILGTGTGFEFHVGASDTYDFDINSVAQLRLNGTSVDVFGNNIVGVGDLTLNDASDIIVNTTTGTKIATATSQKLGFWNTTPVIQPTHIADPTGGATIDSEARTAINSILAQLAAIGLQAAS